MGDQFNYVDLATCIVHGNGKYTTSQLLTRQNGQLETVKMATGKWKTEMIKSSYKCKTIV